MGIDLSPENEQFLQQVVSSGDFSSPGEAVDEALRLLRERQERRAALRRAIQEGQEGEGIPADIFWDEMRRFAEELDAKRQ